jgi:hypothetical protein
MSTEASKNKTGVVSLVSLAERLTASLPLENYELNPRILVQTLPANL